MENKVIDSTINNVNGEFRTDLGSRLYTFEELMELKLPEQNWLVNDWIPEGLIMIAGRPKIGKSLMALDLAMAIASTGHFLNRECVSKKVLFFALEDHPRRIQTRLKRFASEQPNNIDFCFQSTLNKSSFQDLEKKIVQTNAGVVFIDTISRFLPGIDQMDHAVMVNILGGLNQLTQSMNISLILVDHFRKQMYGNSCDPIEDLFGSTGKSSQVDTCVGLYRNPGESSFSLKIVSRDNADIELKVHRNVNDLRWKLVDEPNNFQEDSRKKKILNAIDFSNTNGELATVTSIADHTGIEKSNVSHDLKDLCLQEIVVKGKKIGKDQPYEIIKN